MKNNKKNILENLILIILLSIYTLIFILISLHRYWQFSSFYLDLGLYDQAIWRASRFQIPLIDHIWVPGKMIFADHFNPSIFLFTPLFWIWQKTEILLITQAVCVGLSAFIIYQIARGEIKSYLVRIALLFSYLGFVGLQNALITDFHDATILVLPLSLAFWAIFREKWKIYFICLFIILGLKESMAGLGLGLGIYLLLRAKRHIRIGIATILISLIWGLLAVLVIIPYFAGGIYYQGPHIPKSILEWLKAFFWPQPKLNTLFYTFTTFGFIPLGYLPLLPAILENFFERFVLRTETTRWGLGFHYSAPLSPLLFIACLEFIRNKKWIFKSSSVIKLWAFSVILMVIILNRFILHGPLMLAFIPDFYKNTTQNQFLNEFISKIPRNGLIMTQQHLAVRFAHNCVIMLKDNYPEYEPDYIALDLRKGQNPANFYPLTEQGTQNLFARLINDQKYKMTQLTDHTYLFSKKDKNGKYKKTYCPFLN